MQKSISVAEPEGEPPWRAMDKALIMANIQFHTAHEEEGPTKGFNSEIRKIEDGEE